MKTDFRARMGDMHTWAGVVLGALLFAIFWTGSLAVFDREIDRWMMPATRLAFDASAPRPSLDGGVRPLLEQRAPKAPAWTIILPNERTPFMTLAYGTEESRKSSRDLFDPLTLAQLPRLDTLGASGFLYPFHHNLTIRYLDIGAWIVGVAAMAMLCLLVSGITIHRRLFAEFFTLRLWRAFGRSNLDVHNLSGVVLLPFHILITLSGLIIAFSIYFPFAHEALYAPRAEPVREAPRQRDAGARAETPERAFLREALGQERLPGAGRPARPASLERMVAEAEAHWGEGAVYLLRVNNPGDAGGNVVLRRSSGGTVTRDIDNFRFSAATGEHIGRFQASATVNVWSFIGGTHYIQFRHWPLRWLYFLGGIGGCVMIATGLFFWTQARRRRQQRRRHAGVSLMDAVGVAGVCGIIAATLAFFIANKWLPARDTVWGIDRAQCEVLAFYVAWVAAAVHALLRVACGGRTGHLAAWREQCGVVAVLAPAAVLSNWLATGDHLLATVGRGYWPVAGMDLALLVGAVLAAVAASRLARHERSSAAAGKEAAGPAADEEPAHV